MKRMIGAIAAALLLSACGNSQTVQQPMTDVHATLVSIPAEADAFSTATTFPNTDYFLEDQGNRLIWHFRHEGMDYGRFVVDLKEAGPQATKVSTSFENAWDAKIADQLDFLRSVARDAGNASVNAALAGVAVDKPSIEAQITRDPMAASAAVIGTVSADLDRHIREQEEWEAANEPALPRPGVAPRKGGRGGPRDDE